ncbi:hypothetical protein DV737_g5619, partial [Chaetothyriales sp. CBS 132003]
MAASSPRMLPILDTPVQSRALLTPPQLPTLTEAAPFKPKDGDEISLSMKRCRHDHKESSRQVHADPGTPGICKGKWQTPSLEATRDRPYYSKSLPSLAGSTTPFLVAKPDSALKLDDRGSAHQGRSRWTLSSKAACTQRRAATAISAVYKSASTVAPDATGLLSPAMIVLRRASMARGSRPKKMSLTVFPEPKFERGRTRVLTSFLRTITGATDEDKEAPWPRADDRCASLASPGGHGAQLSRRGRVKTVCTRVTDVQPTMVSPTGPPVGGETTSRRCSTTYITGDQVFEVVWDENVASHTSTSSSEIETVSRTSSKRRHSIAMESLETRLNKADAQSRRQSQTTTEQWRKSSYDAEHERQRRDDMLLLTEDVATDLGDAAAIPMPHFHRQLHPRPIACQSPQEPQPFAQVLIPPRHSPLRPLLRPPWCLYAAHHACVMTAIPPADPRPPSLPAAGAAGAATPPLLSHEPPRSFLPLAGPVNPSAVRKQADGDLFSTNDGNSIDDRPTKRRRLSTDSGRGPSGAAAGAAVVKTTLVDDYRFLSALVQEGAAGDDGHASTNFPPLPQRPWKLGPTKKSSEVLVPTHRARSPVPVPTTPDTGYSLEGMPRFSNQKPIAYFAWRGRHPEDNLSAENVKTGYFDTPPNPPEKETNTARVAVYNALKHHQGIATLSTLFSLVLEAKNKSGLISSASSFKPPPRVTLAEAKRKSWIGDLADAKVPLRKLSRTIPQGIRGQGLLDQCIQNKVPLGRAIWFTKCVGANEIRTLKRKGTTAQAAVGTETKWVREWTVNVEQFIENIVGQAGQPTWRPNIQYALRLATRLYLESLLDRDHYLDWVLKSFTLSTDQQLPFWLLVVHLYKQDFAKFRKRGRPLAEALLNRYTKMRDLPSPMAQTLTKRLKDTIKSIAVPSSTCFLMPDQWPALRDAFQSCLDLANPAESATMTYLDAINDRCMGVNKHLYLTKISEKDKVVGILDRANAPYDLSSLSHTLLGVCPEGQKLATYCLEWATTKFRCGSARIYLTSRLLRRWLRQGLDLDAAIVHFFDHAAISSSGRNSDALEHIFSDLSRSHSFSASKWLQAINVRGLPHQNTIRTRAIFTASGTSLQQQSADGGTALLMDLSLPKSSGHVVNLRNALLDRAGYNPDLELDAVYKIIAELQQELRSPSLSDRVEAARRKSIKLLLTNWNWRVRNQISHWLRAFVSEAVKTQMSKKDGQSPARVLEHKQFLLIRTALETLGDKPVLADVVGLFSSFTCEQVQASLVETVSRHAVTFSAIGALEPLQVRLTQMYMSLRTVKSTMPLFATALLELCTDSPTNTISAKLLQQDLVRGDRGRAMAACSPFSDGVAESLQQAEATFIDDFEAVLQSEPSMSKQAMSRLFALLTERIEKQQGTIVGEDALFSYSTGCLTIDLLVEAVAVIGISTALAHHSWLVSPGSIAEHPYAYVAATKWIAFSRRKPDEVLNLLGYASQADRDGFEITVCINLVQTASIDLASLPQPSRLSLEKNLASLLDIDNQSESAFRSALVVLDVFSTRFVQAQLRLLSSTSTPEEANAIAVAISEVVCDPQQSASATDQISTVLQAAEGEVAAQVRQIAEDRVMNILPRIGSGKGADCLVLDPKLSASLSRAVDQAFQLCPTPSRPSPKSSQRLVDLLSQILKYLKSSSSGTASVPKTPATATSPSNSSFPAQPPSGIGQTIPTSSPGDAFVGFAPGPVLEYLRIVLQLLCLQRPLPSTPVSAVSAPLPPKQPPDAIRILAHLATIITHHELTSALEDSDRALASLAHEVTNFAYDVMATYVDEVSDEGRQLLSKIVRDKLRDGNDARFRCLFGSVGTCGSEIPGGEELGKGLLIYWERGTILIQPAGRGLYWN